MSSLVQVLNNSSKLSDVCKTDLLTHIVKLQLESEQQQKKPITIYDKNLPSVLNAGTQSHQAKTRQQQSLMNDVKKEFELRKKRQSRLLQSVVGDTNHTLDSNNLNHNVSNSFLYTKKYMKEFQDCAQGEQGDSAAYAAVKSNLFVNGRRRDELSDKDIDFVHRYAQKMTHQHITSSPQTETSKAKIAAVEAYKKAFMSYKGRQPTSTELQQINRLYFGFDEYGNVGVVQKPHTCYPHFHYSTRCVNHTCCPQQVYLPQQRSTRAARDRFPGPIPIKSSTKNSNMMVSLTNEPASGHQQVNTYVKKSTLIQTMTKSC